MKRDYKKYLTKREILEKFTLDQLKEICSIFQINHSQQNKIKIVLVLEKTKKVSKEFLSVLLEVEGKTIKEKITNLRNNFYEHFIQKRNDFLENFKDNLAEFLSPGVCSDIEKLQVLERQIRHLKEFVEEELPSNLITIITPRQKKAYYAVRNEIKITTKFVEDILSLSKDDPNVQDITELKEKITNERIFHYLKEARKCYAIRSYDATVVMIARATEYILKECLKKNKISFSQKDTIGKLKTIFEQNFKDNTSKRTLGKIIEVHNFDRIVGAHDTQQDRKYISKDEADHAWTAIQVILRELLGIEYQPYLE